SLTTKSMGRPNYSATRGGGLCRCHPDLSCLFAILSHIRTKGGLCKPHCADGMSSPNRLSWFSLCSVGVWNAVSVLRLFWMEPAFVPIGSAKYLNAGSRWKQHGKRRHIVE